MGQLFVFNASRSNIFISFNNGDFLKVPSADGTSWEPSPVEDEPSFVNNVTPGQGQLGLGINNITVYPSTGGTSHSVTFELDVPENIPISTVQIYLFWKNATSVAWVALSDGQPFQVSFVAEHKNCVSTSQAVQTSNAAHIELQSMDSTTHPNHVVVNGSI